MRQLKKYIQGFDFDYAISYSGLRGEKLEKYRMENEEKLGRLKREIETARFMQKPELRREIDALETEIRLGNPLIINEHGEIHSTGVIVYRFEKGAKETNALLEILRTESAVLIAAPCLPIFRDSIVFYSSENKISGILHICFQCYQMRNESAEDLIFGTEEFQKLTNELIKAGHPIEYT